MQTNYNITETLATLATLACLDKIQSFGLLLQSSISDIFKYRYYEFVSDFTQALNLR